MLYRLAVRFFNLVSPSLKAVFFIFIVLFLSFSLLISRFLLRWRENFFTRDYYIFSNFWLGAVAILLIVAALVWLTIKILKWKEPGSRVVILSAVAFLLAIGWSGYGLWNAFNPQIKEIEVKLANLPPEWRGRTIVQLSDIHLGPIHQAAFMQKIVEKTNSLHPDLVVITGDLFNGADGDLESFVKPVNRLEAPKGIFFVTGNHELFLGLKKVYSLLATIRIKVLKDQCVNIDGLQLVGLGYSSFAGQTNIERIIHSMPDFKRGLPSILLYHTPTNIQQAKNSGINLQLSGHTHKGQFFLIEPFEYRIYKKYYYGLHQEGDYSIYTSSGLGTIGPPMRINSHSEIVAIRLK